VFDNSYSRNVYQNKQLKKTLLYLLDLHMLMPSNKGEYANLVFLQSVMFFKYQISWKRLLHHKNMSQHT